VRDNDIPQQSTKDTLGFIAQVLLLLSIQAQEKLFIPVSSLLPGRSAIIMFHAGLESQKFYMNSISVLVR